MIAAELVERVKTHKPGFPTLATSGYAGGDLNFDVVTPLRQADRAQALHRPID